MDNLVSPLDILNAAVEKALFVRRVIGTMRSPKEYTVLSQTGGLVMALFAGIFAVFVQLLDAKPNDDTIWNVIRTLSYIGIVMNASGVFTAFILVIDADVKATTAGEDMVIRFVLNFAYFWMINCLSLSIGIFLIMIGLWVWAKESNGVAIASTVFLIVAGFPYSVFWVIVIGKVVFYWRSLARMGPQEQQDYLDQREAMQNQLLGLGAANAPP